ncbi:MAG: sulfotransferase family 2 domain-containing protein [Pirellulaceae bacterium]
MKQYDPHKPIIYTHIPKCAGTSVVRLLKEWFGPTYHKLNQDESKDILLPKVETRDEDGRWRDDVRCIHGHFNHGRGYGLPYYYPEIDQYFTILRDPFDLTVSMYFFAKGRSAEGRFWYRGQAVDFSDQFGSVVEYVRSYPYWLFHHLPQDLTLDNYEEKLASRFVYIGVFEDMQTSISNLAKIFGKPDCELPQLNVSNYDERVPEFLRDNFYADYPLLKKVYDYALATYRDASAAMPDSGTISEQESPNASASRAG